MGFFSQKLPHFRRNWNKWFFFRFFIKIWKEISDFPDKTEKKFKSYKFVKKSVDVYYKIN